MNKLSFEQEQYLSDLPVILAITNVLVQNFKPDCRRERIHERPIVPRLMRKCKLCSLNETDNQYHLLLISPYFAEIGNKYRQAKYLGKAIMSTCYEFNME